MEHQGVFQMVPDRGQLVAAVALTALVMSLVAVVLIAAMFVPFGGSCARFVG